MLTTYLNDISRIPLLTRAEALAGLSPLDLGDCCHLRESMGVSPLVLDGFRVESAAGGDPLLRGVLPGGGRLTVNLVSGRVLDDWPDIALIHEGSRKHAALNVVVSVRVTGPW